MQRVGLCLLLALLASCTPARTVMIDGAPIPYEQATRDQFRKGKSALDAGKYDEAAAAFQQFLEQFPDSELADEALYRRGQALSKAGKLDDAQKALEELLEHHPGSPFKKPAAVELNLVQAKLGKKHDLEVMVAEMSESEKAQSAAALSEAYTKSGQAGEGARWAVKAVEAAPEGAERDARLHDLDDALQSAPAQDVARMVAELSKSSPAWPAAALRLSRIQLHTGDRAHANDLAGEIISASGGSGPYADGARQIQHAVAQAAQVKPNLIGILLPLSGDLKGFADQALNGISLTLNLDGRGPLQVEVKDSKGEPEAAAEAVEELAEHGAIAILGPLGIPEGLAAATRAQQLGIPMISLSRADGLTALGDYIFRDMPTSATQARAVADYAQKKLNVQRFGVLQPDSAYGDEMTRYFWDAVEAGGASMRAFDHYPVRTTTFKPFIQRMVGRTPSDLAERQEFADETKKLQEITDPYKRRKAYEKLKSAQAPVVDFDAIFIPDSARTVRLVAPAIAAEDVITAGCDTKELEVVKKTTRNDQLRTVQLLGTSLWDSADLVDERSGVARYVQCAIFVDVFFAASDRPATKKFVDDYGTAYKRAPGFLEAHAHDAASLLKKAWEEKHPSTREQMRDALAGMTKPFEGAAGDTLFGKDREAQKQLFWLWINRGTIQEFDPEGAPPVPPAAPLPPKKQPKLRKFRAPRRFVRSLTSRATE